VEEQAGAVNELDAITESIIRTRASLYVSRSFWPAAAVEKRSRQLRAHEGEGIPPAPSNRGRIDGERELQKLSREVNDRHIGRAAASASARKRISASFATERGTYEALPVRSDDDDIGVFPSNAHRSDDRERVERDPGAGVVEDRWRGSLLMDRLRDSLRRCCNARRRRVRHGAAHAIAASTVEYGKRGLNFAKAVSGKGGRLGRASVGNGARPAASSAPTNSRRLGFMQLKVLRPARLCHLDRCSLRQAAWRECVHCRPGRASTRSRFVAAVRVARKDPDVVVVAPDGKSSYVPRSVANDALMRFLAEQKQQPSDVTVVHFTREFLQLALAINSSTIDGAWRDALALMGSQLRERFSTAAAAKSSLKRTSSPGSG